MNKYVSTELLKQTFAKALNEIEGLSVPLSEVAILIGRVIKDTPVAKVEASKHGKWIVDDSGTVICSECGEEHEWDEFRPPYCDMCGSKNESAEENSDD